MTVIILELDYINSFVTKDKGTNLDNNMHYTIGTVELKVIFI